VIWVTSLQPQMALRWFPPWGGTSELGLALLISGIAVGQPHAAAVRVAHPLMLRAIAVAKKKNGPPLCESLHDERR
jgi:hypothetical protein